MNKGTGVHKNKDIKQLSQVVTITYRDVPVLGFDLILIESRNKNESIVHNVMFEWWLLSHIVTHVEFILRQRKENRNPLYIPENIEQHRTFNQIKRAAFFDVPLKKSRKFSL